MAHVGVPMTPCTPLSVYDSPTDTPLGDGSGFPKSSVQSPRQDKAASPGLNKGSWYLNEGGAIDPRKYEIDAYLGKGAYAMVCSARELGSQPPQTVAIKKIRDVFNNLTDAKRILREISLLSRLKHPNMVKILDIPEPPKDARNFRDLYIVFEYVESDLARVLSSQQPLLRDQLQYITMQLLAGMRHMHAHHVLHRDLKPQNVLVSRYCEIKICDLGLARGIAELESGAQGGGDEGLSSPENPLLREMAADRTQEQMNSPLMLTRQLTKHVVTRWYRAPELILQKTDYTHAIDVWSIGCIFAELLNMHASGGQGTANFVLFPGRSCFPMSPSKDDDEDEDSPFDQLNVIFNMIGSPTQIEIDKVQDADARNWLQKLHDRGGVKSQQLDDLFPGAAATAVDMLKRMISFDPDYRITIEEATRHPFFDEGGAREGNLYTPINLDFSKESVPLNFDFEKLAQPSVRDIKQLLYEEVARFNAKKAGLASPLFQAKPAAVDPPEASLDSPEGSPTKRQRLEEPFDDSQ